MRILIVEDDPTIATHIVSNLRRKGHEAAHAATGRAAIECLDNQLHDAVVLDRLLPDTNGLAILDCLRERRNRIPVLMLSALGSVNDRIEGLQQGADDYLAKPFNLDELEARLQTIARRSGAGGEATELRVGNLMLNASAHRAIYLCESQTLNRKQFSLLAHLMQNADRLVTRAMLLERVWGYSFSPTTNIVESNMSRLRAVLQVLGCDPIETRRGAGYILRSDLCA